MNQITELPSKDKLPATTRIAILQADWHADILEEGRRSFIDTMGKFGLPDTAIDTYTVSGAFELPLQAKAIVHSGRHDAIVASALVVDGGIYRHDFVASAVLQGLMTIQLEMIVPVLSMVLTPHHFHDHEEHHRFFADHFRTKGEEVAIACVKTMLNLRDMRRNMVAAR